MRRDGDSGRGQKLVEIAHADQNAAPALWIGSGDARERQAPVVEQCTQGGLADAETLAGLCNRDG
jgi:hypothetical protein